MSIWKCKCTIFLYRYYSIFELFFDPIFSSFEGILPYYTTTLIYNKCNLVCKNSLVKKSSAKETNNISQTFHVTFFKKECCKARIKTDTVWQKNTLKKWQVYAWWDDPEECFKICHIFGNTTTIAGFFISSYFFP